MATIRDEIKKLEAYGTSEGASKAWDTRGRGEHYGKYEKGERQAAKFSSRSNPTPSRGMLSTYRGPEKHRVVVQEFPQRNRAHAYHEGTTGAGDSHFSGTLGDVKNHLKEAYGIEHQSALRDEVLPKK